MLQGTFETLSLAEVLGLLAASRKTGTLWVEAGAIDAQVSLVEGQCCAAASGDLRDAVSSGAELFVRAVEVCFTVARHEGGAFHFADDEEPPWRCDEVVAIDTVLTELTRQLDEWREIQAVVPSLEVRPRLAEELQRDEITVDKHRWRLLVAIDGERSVREVVQRTGRTVLDVCHELVELSACGAVTIPAPAETDAAEHHSPTAIDAATVVPEPPYGPGVELAAATSPPPSAALPTRATPPAAPAAVDEADEDPGEEEDTDDLEGDGGPDELEPRDRGAFLRLFSALKDAQ